MYDFEFIQSNERIAGKHFWTPIILLLNKAVCEEFVGKQVVRQVKTGNSEENVAEDYKFDMYIENDRDTI